MSKIFRLHSGADNTIADWADTGASIGQTFIDTIADPNGATDKERITSIPSPFAGMDIVRTAFKWINEHNKLEGSTMYHKLVSDSLDVAEIFFNIHSLGKKVKLLSWDPGIVIVAGDITINPASDLGRLINSTDSQHKLFGETLELYLKQDALAYNFTNLKRIFLLQYIGDGGTSVIGGTSPSTLFFPSSNDLSHVNISFGTHKVFNGNYCPLHNRAEDFIKYLFALKANVSGFSSKFKELDDYLSLTLGHTGISQALRANINGILQTPNYFSDNYLPVSVGGAGNPTEVLGFPILADHQHSKRIENNSAFVIDAKKTVASPLPLVLPNSSFTHALTYTIASWDNNKKAPFANDIPFEKINERTLPHQESAYPYLTSDDLFEPYLIRTIFPIQKDKYFDGNLSGTATNDNKGYIIPLKQNIFHYFSVEDIQGLMPDGKPMFEMEHQSLLKVKVTLRIPIRSVSQLQKDAGGIYTKHYVEFVREYNANVRETAIEQPDIQKNKGVIIENQFTLSIYPFLKTGTDDKADYRVMLIDGNLSPLNKNNLFLLEFFKNNSNTAIAPVVKKSRSDKNLDGGASSNYFILNKEFDFIQLSSGPFKGIIIPQFTKVTSGTSEFNFAVDFGTTNTHIEYTVNANLPQPFEITNDEQFSTLHIKGMDIAAWAGADYNAIRIQQILSQENMPSQIMEDSEYKFPIRTVVSQNKRLNLATTTYANADISIFFNHEKYKSLNSEEITTNLKWKNFGLNNEIKKIEAYFEQLIHMMRVKVLLNGGNLSLTKLVWFYPSSMSILQRNLLENLWTTLFNKLAASSTPIAISESIAPFYFYNKTGLVTAAVKPVLSIDIGGGTTDVILFQKDGAKINVPIFQTSFRYAANAIFGNGFGSFSTRNGFVNKYQPILSRLVNDNNIGGGLRPLISDASTTTSLEDLNTFYLSLEKNWDVVQAQAKISYSDLLKNDEDMKIVFLVFYSSIIYYISKLLVANNIETPCQILFSGNGSKTLSILDSSSKLTSLTTLSEAIFAQAGLTKPGDFKLKQVPNPKEITAKGGLLNIGATLTKETIKVFKFIEGVDENSSVTYENLHHENIKNGALANTQKFIEDFFDLNDKNLINFQEYFGIAGGNLENYKSILLDNLDNFLAEGIDQKVSEMQGNLGMEIGETLFFYPLIGALNNLAFEISESSTNA